MSFLAPGWLLAGAAAAALVGLLHLLAWRRPQETPLPTARFAPDRPARAAARALRPTDLALLALRALLVMLVAAAFARPVLGRPAGVGRVVLADRSRAVASPAEVRDSVRRLVRPGDVVVTFDTGARADPVRDSATLTADSVPRAAGSLSAALVAASRAAPRLRRQADSLELVIVSPLLREDIDAATAALRARWRGRARLVPVAARRDSTPPFAVDAPGSADDPVIAAVGLRGAVRSGAPVRVVRRAAAAEERRWAAGAGHVLVEWPDSAAPDGWIPRAAADTSGAVTLPDVAVVAPFVRRSRPGTESGARVVARWADGEPAADEITDGEGCIRRVAVSVPAAGDLALRPAFGAFVRGLLGPCGGAVDLAPVPDSVRALLAGRGALLATASLPPADERSALAPWLIGAALLLALVELFARRAPRVA